MFQDKKLIESGYREFIKDIVAKGEVWMLEDGESAGVSTSNEFFNEDGEEMGVVLFWYKKSHAQSVAVQEWSDYKPVPVALDVFLEFSVIQISNEDMLMGINWTPSMTGKEIHPIEIAIDIIAELEATGKPIALKHHTDLAAYKEITMRVSEEIFGHDE